MVTKNKAYKRNLERYGKVLVNSGVAECRVDLVCSILDGSYRNKMGIGSTRSYNGLRVDTYEGRIEAVKSFMGLNNSRYFYSLEKLMATNDYLKTAKSKKVENKGVLRGEIVQNYIKGLYQGAESVERTLNPQVAVYKKELVVANNSLSASELKREDLQETLNNAEYVAAEKLISVKRKSLKTLAIAASLAFVVGAGLGVGCSREKKVSSNNLDHHQNKATTTQINSQLNGGITPNQLRKFYDDNPAAIPNYSIKEKSSFPISVLYPRLESPKNSLCYTGIKSKNALKITPTKDLGKIVTVGKVSWHEIPAEKRTTNLYYAEKEKAEPIKEEIKVVQQEKNNVVDAQIKPVGTNGLYRMHVDFRNLQSRDRDGDSLDDKVSASPVYFGRALKNEVVSFGEGVADGKDLGYADGKEKGRAKNIGRALVSPLDSVLGFVSGGRWGLHKDTRESRSEDNILLGSIRSVYDGVQSIAKGVVAVPDLALGGLTEKVVYDVVGGGAKTLVNSTVDAGNFAFAVPLDASQRFENWAFKNKGKVSMETYELASTLMRFGGNVILHEAPFDGKYVEVRNEAGEKVLINKGQTGATLESLMAVLLDAGVLSQIHSGGDDGSFGNSSSGGFSRSGSPGGF